MSRKPSDHVALRRLRLPQRGLVRRLFSWKHGREIFNPSASYYLAFLFAFYAFGLPHLIFFMVVSSFGPTGGLPIDLNRYFGSESVNDFSEEFAIGEPKLVELMEGSRWYDVKAPVLVVLILRGGAVEVNGKGMSNRDFEQLVSNSAKETEFIVRPDPDVTFGRFMRVLDLLEQAVADESIRRENVYILGPSAFGDIVF